MAKTPPIERAIFREAPDGSTVFFPWGLSRRGYRLPDESHRARALRATSLLLGCTIAIGTWTAHRLQPLLEPGGDAGARDWMGVLAVPALLMAAAVLGYALRVWHLVEGAQESDLRISREDQLREAAELVNPREITLVGAVFAALSGVVFWIAPHAWWMGALGVAAGLFMMYWSHVLRRAKRTAADDEPGPPRPIG